MKSRGDHDISYEEATIKDAAALRWLGRSFWRRRRLIAFLVVSGTLIAALLGFTTPPLYSATSLLFIKPRSEQVLQFETATVSLSTDLVAVQAQMDTYVRMITAYSQLRSAAQHIERVRPDLLPFPANEVSVQAAQPAEALCIAHTNLLSREFTEGSNSDANTFPPALPSDDKDAAVVQYLRAGLTVGQQSKSQLIGVSFASTNPVISAEIANMVAEHFVTCLLEQKRVTTMQIGNALDARVDELQQSVRQAEDLVLQHREKHDLWGDAAEDAALRHIAEINESLLAATANLEFATSRIRAEREVASERVSSLRTAKRNAERALLEKQAALVQLQALTRDAEAARRIYEAVRQRYFEIREEEHMVTADVEIMSAAVAPTNPSSPGVALMAAMGLIASSMLAATLALAVELASNPTRSESGEPM